MESIMWVSPTGVVWTVFSVIALAMIIIGVLVWLIWKDSNGKYAGKAIIWLGVGVIVITWSMYQENILQAILYGNLAVLVLFGLFKLIQKGWAAYMLKWDD